MHKLERLNVAWFRATWVSDTKLYWFKDWLYYMTDRAPDWLVCLLVRLCARSLVHSSACSFVRSFVRLFEWMGMFVTCVHIQTELKFDLWRSHAAHATSRSRILPIILNIYEWTYRRSIINFFETRIKESRIFAWMLQAGRKPQTPAW